MGGCNGRRGGGTLLDSHPRALFSSRQRCELNEEVKVMAEEERKMGKEDGVNKKRRKETKDRVKGREKYMERDGEGWRGMEDGC